MAAFTRVNNFTEQLTRGIQSFGSDVFKLALTNTAPTVSQTGWNLTDHPAPTAANGYTSGGYVVTCTVSETAGVTTVQGSQVVVTATAGGIGPFRYAVLYNDTEAGKDLVGFSDYGSSITLNDGETLTVKFNNANPGTIFTVGA